MKTLRKLILVVFFAGTTAPINAALSQELNQRLDAILRNLHEIEKSVKPLKRELIILANQINKAGNEAFIKELEEWYGGYVHEMPDRYLKVYSDQGDKILRKLGAKQQSLEELRGILRKGSQQDRAKAIPYSPPIAKLRDNHAATEYLAAWKFWLMAPPSKERNFMRGHINQALQKIGDNSVIPLVVETLKIEVQRAKKESIKKSLAIASVNLICSMPDKQSLGALLEINRYATASDLNREDYYKSISRHIIRRLASRRSYADQLINPKMKVIIERQGYNEKPEDIPLTDELWKKYKPLLEARLVTKTDKLPQADIELINSALEIMPKG